MLTKEQLLDIPEIADFIQTHQSQKDKMQNAAKYFVDLKDDKLTFDGAKASLVKLKDAFENNKIFVFFSFKTKDEDVAKEIVTHLSKWSAGTLHIRSQLDFIRKFSGQEYRREIYKAIKQSNWFILLLPDPKEDWDWVLFETGLFEAQRTPADRLICLHHPDNKLPGPIDDYQAICAEQNKVEEMLKMMFIDQNPIPGLAPLNSSLADDIPQMAARIVDVIRTPINLVRTIYEPWVELIIQQPESLQEIEQLDKAIVKSANLKALKLFGLDEEQPATWEHTTWGSFRENILAQSEQSDQWLLEMVHVICKIAKGHNYEPIHAVFQAHDGTMHRPVICALDRDGLRGPIHTFHITFHKDVSTVDRSAMPRELSLLANLLRSTFRFRWEVLEKYSKSPLTIDDVDRLSNAMSRIEQDWESKNLGNEREIHLLFPNGEGGMRLTEMVKSWRKARNEFKTGALDIAIEEKNIETIPQILGSFLPQNQEFLQMVAERFSKLVAHK